MTQPHLRGVLSTFTFLTALVGFLLQYSLGTLLPWRPLALLNGIVPVITVLLLCIIPETPIWYMTKNRPEEAKRSLAWLRGWTKTEKIEAEFEELWSKVNEEIVQKKHKRSFFESVEMFKKKEIYKPMALIILSYALALFGGEPCISAYAVPIFSSLRAPINEFYVTVILGVMKLAGCCFSMSLINVLGKRVLTFTSLAGCGVCLLATAIYVSFYDILYLHYNHTEDTTKHWVPVILLLLSEFSAHLGIAILPWLLIGEVFPDEGRATASGISAAIGCFTNSLSTKLFPTLVFSITLPGVLLIYSLVSFFGIPALYFFLPETEGKSLHEISDHFKGAVKMDNKVKRRIKETEVNLENLNC